MHTAHGAADGALDIRPGGDDRAEHHEAEREKRERADAAAEPEYFSVGDDNDGKVLEDGVDWHRQKLERLCACVDHGDEEDRDRKPYDRRSAAAHMARRSFRSRRDIVHFFALFASNPESPCIIPICLKNRTVTIQTMD
jgi:hypothetical protein